MAEQHLGLRLRLDLGLGWFVGWRNAPNIFQMMTGQRSEKEAAKEKDTSVPNSSIKKKAL